MIWSAASTVESPCSQPYVVEEAAGLVNRRQHRRVVDLDELEVLAAAAGRDVDDPGPSSSETSSHGITRCSTSAPGPSSSNGPE